MEKRVQYGREGDIGGEKKGMNQRKEGRGSERGSFLHYLKTRRIKEKHVPPPFLSLSCQ